MNAVEIEQAISELAQAPYDRAEFPYLFLASFGEKATTLKRLRTGNSNKSDVAGGILQRNNIHIATCDEGAVGETLKALKASPETAKQKAKLILATDGHSFEAEDLISGETIACDYADFANHFGFFLPLAGISTVREIRDNPIDIQATSRLNRLYVELLKHNPDWDTAERRHDMNQFMARLIFCFFAEDTDIFNGEALFTKTIEQMSEADASNLDYVIGEMFRAMDIAIADRAGAGLPSWADQFPYVNGGLFDGTRDVPKFPRIARSYLIHAGSLNWQEINPDIFGSMIQAVADDEERGALGMHYTSVPNILKVLNPLFLDELREQLEDAGDNPRKLLNLRKRMARIRVFDPACGSGNFLVIAYKQMRAIEAEVNQRRGEAAIKSEIPLTNFRGIEIRDFPAEIARLALIIAEYQCDVAYRGQKDALAEFLPLNRMNWIVCGNALRLDWLSICPPTGEAVKHHAEDLFHTPLDQTEIDFANEGGETFICGNPPYLGDKLLSKEQKSDMERLLASVSTRWKSFDYICGFFFKSISYLRCVGTAEAALVSTNSISQGVQASQFWSAALGQAHIRFAYTSFKWNNLAANNAGVICVIIGLTNDPKKERQIFTDNRSLKVDNISPYLIPSQNVLVVERRSPISEVSPMLLGNVPKDGGNLLLSPEQYTSFPSEARKYIRPLYGSQEFIKGTCRYCLWLSDADLENALQITDINDRLARVVSMRNNSSKKATRAWSKQPHKFVEIRAPEYDEVMAVPRVSSETREYLPVGFLPSRSVVLDSAFALYDAPLWNMALIASKIHLVWVATVCGKLKTDYRYSNTLGWNTFPVPKLTEQNKADLTRCAEDILLAREAHFPATIADLYKPDEMPDNLRAAHERNDEVLERIYIGRRFKNDTERLETLFDLYTKMTSSSPSGKQP